MGRTLVVECVVLRYAIAFEKWNSVDLVLLEDHLIDESRNTELPYNFNQVDFVEHVLLRLVEYAISDSVFSLATEVETTATARWIAYTSTATLLPRVEERSFTVHFVKQFTLSRNSWFGEVFRIVELIISFLNGVKLSKHQVINCKITSFFVEGIAEIFQCVHETAESRKQSEESNPGVDVVILCRIQRHLINNVGFHWEVSEGSNAGLIVNWILNFVSCSEISFILNPHASIKPREVILCIWNLHFNWGNCRLIWDKSWCQEAALEICCLRLIFWQLLMSIRESLVCENLGLDFIGILVTCWTWLAAAVVSVIVQRFASTLNH